MNSTQKRWLMTSLCALGVVTFCTAFALSNSRKYPALTLGNGSRVEFLGWTSGHLHVNPGLNVLKRWEVQLSLEKQSPLSKAFLPVLTRLNRNTQGDVIASCQFPNVFWFRLRGEPSNLPLSARFFDGDGDETGRQMPIPFRTAASDSTIIVPGNDPDFQGARIRRIALYEGPYSILDAMPLDTVTSLDLPVGTFEIDVERD